MTTSRSIHTAAIPSWILANTDHRLDSPNHHCRWQKVTSRRRHTQASREKLRGVDPELSSGLKGDTRPDGRDLGRASHFDPTIDKERKVIRNLRWNMLVFVQTDPNVRLSSR
jgi:hypothetical protein